MTLELEKRIRRAYQRRGRLVTKKHWGNGLTDKEARELARLEMRIDNFELEEAAPGLRRMRRTTLELQNLSLRAAVLRFALHPCHQLTHVHDDCKLSALPLEKYCDGCMARHVIALTDTEAHELAGRAQTKGGTG